MDWDLFLGWKNLECCLCSMCWNEGGVLYSGNIVLNVSVNEVSAGLAMEGRRAPPVPPKPKSAAPPPAVPQSCAVRTAREPSYCGRLPPLYANERFYANTNTISGMAGPPSPVSSSYSELRRAGPAEPLYEPISPRPGSQLSAGSAAELYAARGEAEVDALTELLVRSLGTDQHPPLELYGVCVACGEPILGETEGCTAMDRVYHVRCFCCCRCAIQLQGKPFYPLDGKPYCREDYLNTLEKCCVCTRPILDRILRATGKPYHPNCFTCIICGKSLDGIPFTVDATNQIHCIEDFHKKFAPRCSVCKKPIMPEPGLERTIRVVALDRSFHVSCYKCEDCGLILSTEAEGRGCYPLDDHVLCKSCNAMRVQALSNPTMTEL